MPDKLLVSEELKGVIDEQQFFGEPTAKDVVVSSSTSNPFYAVLFTPNGNVVGSLVQLEEEVVATPSKHPPAKSVLVRLICRTEDVGVLVKNRYNIELVNICDAEGTIITSHDTALKTVTKFGITQDNPLDSTVYAVYIRFG